MSIFSFLILYLQHHDSLQPFTNDFPRADIHQLLSGDLLHQVIKGTFKDHLVTWVGEYLILEHGSAKGKEILDEIDRRYVLQKSGSALKSELIFILAFLHIESRLHQHFPRYDGSIKGATLSNGQETTAKL